MAKSSNVRERSFDFAVEAVRFCRLVAARDPILRRLAYQLVDAAGQTKPDFIAKNCIALKEARESRFWLRLIAATDPKVGGRPSVSPRRG